MPIRIKTDLNFGDIWYCRSDPDQLPHILTGVVILPGNEIMFKLSYMGDTIELFSFECTQEPSSLAKPNDIEDI